MLLLNLASGLASTGLDQHFNTSYVVIKRHMQSLVQMQKNNFNTSYVVIKPLFLCLCPRLPSISIHLMLLLNAFGLVHLLYKNTFQYILCCY